MKKLFWSLLFLILTSFLQVYAVEEKTIIRVGISDSSFSTYEHQNLDFLLTGSTSIIDMQGERKNYDTPISLNVKIDNGLFKLKTQNDVFEMKGPVTITSTDKIGVKGIKRKGDPAYYDGIIELAAVKSNTFNLINVLSMQSYLKGVVPNEMPISFGFEALKAQAVAARNYANRPITAYKNYDVCDSTACQVYYGANSRTQISDRAVDETKGIYALYNNEIILALYSSTASGISEDYFNTFGNFEEHKPYLTSVVDSTDLEKVSDEEYFKKSIPSFDMKSPKYRWQISFTREELEDILSNTLIAQSKTGAVEPKFNSNDKIEGLEDIKILKKGKSRKALEVEIKSKSGNYIVKKELPIRRIFKKGQTALPSANFIIEKEFDKTFEKEQENTSKAIEQTENNDTIFKSEEHHNRFAENLKGKLLRKLPSKFTFYGAGFGHGVGMSQYGAGYLSSHGVTYDNILKHYYKGITLGTIPKTVLHNNFSVNYSTEFYFNKNKISNKTETLFKNPLKKEINALLDKNRNEKCYLVIDNPHKANKAEFYINGYYFNPELRGFKKKILKTDITKYLIDGVNKITFKPLDEADKRKPVKFYIMLGEENE